MYLGGGGGKKKFIVDFLQIPAWLVICLEASEVDSGGRVKTLTPIPGLATVTSTAAKAW